MKPPKFTALGPGDSETWPPFTGHPNDPRNDDDGEDPNDDDYLTVAREDLKQTPGILTEWLAMECADAYDSLNVFRIEREKPLTDMNVPELFAVVMTGNDEHALPARLELLDRFAEANAELIRINADELKAKIREEQAREAREPDWSHDDD